MFRYDRSMSLPLHSPQSACGDISCDNDNMESYGRKMDFALCKLAFNLFILYIRITHFGIFTIFG